MQELICYSVDNPDEAVIELSQWDKGQSIIIKDTGLDVAPDFHFCNQNSEEALVVSSPDVILDETTGYITVKIPNIILQEPLPIIMFMYENRVLEDDEITYLGQSIGVAKIWVKARLKPSEYKYVENITSINASQLRAELVDFINKKVEQFSPDTDGFYTKEQINNLLKKTYNRIIGVEETYQSFESHYLYDRDLEKQEKSIVIILNNENENGCTTFNELYHEIYDIWNSRVIARLEPKALQSELGDLSNLQSPADNIVSAINELYSKLSNISTTCIYEDYESLINDLNYAPSDVVNYKVGQTIHINKMGVPDLWINNKGNNNYYYSYETDEKFVEELENNGYVWVRNYKLSPIEGIAKYKTELLDTAPINICDGDIVDLSEEVGTSEAWGYKCMLPSSSRRQNIWLYQKNGSSPVYYKIAYYDSGTGYLRKSVEYALQETDARGHHFEGKGIAELYVYVKADKVASKHTLDNTALFAIPVRDAVDNMATPPLISSDIRYLVPINDNSCEEYLYMPSFKKFKIIGTPEDVFDKLRADIFEVMTNYQKLVATYESYSEFKEEVIDQPSEVKDSSERNVYIIKKDETEQNALTIRVTSAYYNILSKSWVYDSRIIGKIERTEVDLTDYYTKEEISEYLDTNYAALEYVTEFQNNLQSQVNDIKSRQFKAHYVTALPNVITAQTYRDLTSELPSKSSNAPVSGWSFDIGGQFNFLATQLYTSFPTLYYRVKVMDDIWGNEKEITCDTPFVESGATIYIYGYGLDNNQMKSVCVIANEMGLGNNETISKNDIWLLRKDVDYCEEYILLPQENRFELIGTSEINLTDYYTKTEVDTSLSGKFDKENIIQEVNGMDESKVPSSRAVYQKIQNTMVALGEELLPFLDEKVNINDIKDNLTSTDANKPLSANQGKLLKDDINNLVNAINEVNTKMNNLNNEEWEFELEDGTTVTKKIAIWE